LKYLLQWDDDALREFTQEWEQVDREYQRQVMDFLDEMDFLLTTKPLEIGESRSSQTDRVLLYQRVVIAYHVDLRLHTVTILEAHLFKRRK
jgi:hypothetical protein